MNLLLAVSFIYSKREVWPFELYSKSGDSIYRCIWPC